MLPLAPGRLSTITGWPRGSDSFCARTRPMMSDGPPAENPTTSRSGRFGYPTAASRDCAQAGTTMANAASAQAARNARLERLMTTSWSGGTRSDATRAGDVAPEKQYGDRKRTSSLRAASLPVPRRFAQDSDAPPVDPDVAAAREVAQHAADHLARRADALADLGVREPLGDENAVGLHGALEQQPGHPAVDVLQRECPPPRHGATEEEDHPLEIGQRELRVAEQQALELRHRRRGEAQVLDRDDRGEHRLGPDRLRGEILPRTDDRDVHLSAGIVAPEELDLSREDDAEEREAVALGHEDGPLRIGADGELPCRRLQVLGRERSKQRRAGEVGCGRAGHRLRRLDRSGRTAAATPR